MSRKSGEPVTLVLHSADASAGVEVPIFSQGSVTARTLAENEYLVISDVLIVAAAGGDAFVHFGTTADTTPDDAKTIARGTVAATGGLGRGSDFVATGLRQEKVFAVAPAGVIDVHLTGSIHNISDGKRPNWRESTV